MRSLILIVSLSVFLFQPVLAATESVASKYEDILGRARSLALQHDRLQATSLLRGAITALDKESAIKPKQKLALREQLTATLEKLSQLFFEDKTQQLYELARSIQFEDSARALTRLEEADRIESGNESILLLMAGLLVGAGQCEKAEAILARVLETNPYSEQAALELGQAYHCQMSPERLFSLVAAQGEKGTSSPHWQALKARSWIKIGAFDRAQSALEEAIKAEPSYPEPYFLLHEVLVGAPELTSEQRERLQTKFDPAETYLKMCATLSLRAKRRHSIDPWLCHASQTAKIEQNKEEVQKSKEQ